MLFRLFVLHCLVYFAASIACAQPEATPPIIVTAACFQGETDSTNRLDVYLATPFSSLQFIKTGTAYTAEYEAIITLRDSLGHKFQEKNLTRQCVASNYETSRGASGVADYSQNIFFIPPGKFTIEVTVKDIAAKRELRSTTTVNAARFRSKLFNISDLLLVSSIEESGGRYAITPFISNNISRLTEPFFIFFETYNNTSDIEEADFLYEIIDSKGAIVQRGDRIKMNIKSDAEQHFMSAPPQKMLPSGEYSLKVIMLKSASQKNANYSQSDVLASSSRSVVIERNAADASGKDLDKLIRQMIYVAYQSDIDPIESAVSPEEKRRLFDEYWRRLDPTPMSEQNEAFDEYYARIEYADRQFRATRDGWLSDMGAVYVIFGRPINIERSAASALSGRNYEKWTMSNNRQFTFIDDMGFGEYRLTTPLTSNDKFKYGN